MSLLLPDPLDPLCPNEFKESAKRLLSSFIPAPRRWLQLVGSDRGLRDVLLEFIADYASWENSRNPDFVRLSRELIQAANGEEPPVVVDPFSGGGSIPLEALRIGCDAFATDLNPVACFILKVKLDYVAREGTELIERLEEALSRIRAQLEPELGSLYPKDHDGSSPVNYFWARTVRCEAVGCGAEIPLLKSFWISQTPRLRKALRYSIRRPSKESPPEIEFELFTPKSESEVPPPSVSRAKATCLACGSVLAPPRVRIQLTAQGGGADPQFDSSGRRVGGSKLMAVVTANDRGVERQVRLPDATDYDVVRRCQKILGEHVERDPAFYGVTEPLPLMSGTFNVPLYGICTWGQLFTARQRLTLLTLSKQISQEHANSKSPAVPALLACALSIFARVCNANARMRPDSSAAPAFGMQALPMTWAFPESVVWGRRSENFDGAVSTVIDVLRTGGLSFSSHPGVVQQADATASPLADASADVWFTDPPYYFAVPYADLSDFFFVWLKRALPGMPMWQDSRSPSNPLTPKERELCEMAHWDRERYAHKTKDYFEAGMAAAFKEGRRVLREHGVGTVVFAHKTTEGWEALLSGLIAGGWVIQASWPISTEAANRLRARDAAALATSVHLICRPRPDSELVGDWSEVVRELPKRVGDWMERLASEGVRGADLVFACIGPAMEIFSRYSRVEDAEGRIVPLGGDPEAREPYKRGYLAYVWESVGRAALNQVLGTGTLRPTDGAVALEEDARLTALFLWTLQATTVTNDDIGDEADEEDDEEGERPRKGKKGPTLIYDVVRRFAQPLGIHLDQWEHRIIETDKGIVRLLPVHERAAQLFGEDGAGAVAAKIEAGASAGKQVSFDFAFDRQPQTASVAKRGGRRRVDVSDADLRTRQQATTLDRVHASMLLQASGRANALRSFLKAEIERGPDFLRLANALSALYPLDSEEKRLVDAMVLAVPR